VAEHDRHRADRQDAVEVVEHVDAEGRVARRKRAVSANWAANIAMPAKPSPMAKSHQKPPPGGTSPVSSTTIGRTIIPK
jgi:hypothetical protein